MQAPSQRLTNWILRGRDPGDSDARAQVGKLSGALGIGLNLLLSVLKLVAGALSRSLAMTADALNNLTDAGSSLVTLVGFRVAGQKADAEHPFGHGRAEYVSGLIISLLILLVGLELGKSSVEKIIVPESVAFSWFAAGILALGVAVKLWMWRFNAALGRTIQSQALAASSLDALSDSAATAAVLLGTLLGHFARLSLDGWLGLGVAAFILVSGIRSVRDTLDPLLGRPASPELTAEITRLVLEQEEIAGIHELMVHEYGPGHLFATIHAEVSPQLTLLAAHAAADRAERLLRDCLGVQAVIHVDPEEREGEPEEG